MNTNERGNPSRVAGRLFAGVCAVLVFAALALLTADFIRRCGAGFGALWQEAFEVTEDRIGSIFDGDGLLDGLVNIVIGLPLYAIHFVGILTWPLPLAWLCWRLLRAMRKHPDWQRGAFRAPATRPWPEAPKNLPPEAAGPGGAQVHKGTNLLLMKVWLLRLGRVAAWLAIIAALAVIVCGYRYVVLTPDCFPEEPVLKVQPLLDGMSAWVDENAADVPVLGDLLEMAVVLAGLVLGLVEIGLTVLWPLLLGLVIILFAAAAGSAAKEAQHIREAGVRGERIALELAEQLPAGCHVFTNQIIWFEREDEKRSGPGEGKRSNRSELDLILVGPGGVAIVEVKHYSGAISGNIRDEELRRITPGGREKKIRNPAKQIGTHVWRLSNYLKSQGLRVWIDPYVLFTHPKVTFSIDMRDYDEDDMDALQARRSQVTCLGAKDFGQIVQAMTKRQLLRPEQVDDIVRAIMNNRRP